MKIKDFKSFFREIMQLEQRETEIPKEKFQYLTSTEKNLPI